MDPGAASKAAVARQGSEGRKLRVLPIHHISSPIILLGPILICVHTCTLLSFYRHMYVLELVGGETSASPRGRDRTCVPRGHFLEASCAELVRGITISLCLEVLEEVMA